MSDAKNTGTVEVPREVVERVLMALDQGNAFNCAADLRACIKPRRWEFERRYAQVAIDGFFECAYGLHQKEGNAYRVPVRVIVEEIL